jgi:hypothetical protein
VLSKLHAFFFFFLAHMLACTMPFSILKENYWEELNMLEITINFLVFLLCFASCTLDFIIIIFFSCTHVSMYHVSSVL